MISRIYVIPKKWGGTRDHYVINSYLFVHELSEQDLEVVARSLTNEVIEKWSIDTLPREKGFTYAIEVGYKPGVTDNVAHTVHETVADLLNNATDLEIYSSKIFITKHKSTAAASAFASSLYNPLIERVHIVKSSQEKFQIPLETPKVILNVQNPVIKVSLNVPDDELVRIGREGIKGDNGVRRGPLALDLESMKAIKNYFSKIGRDPNDIELESLAQTWSEHCKHTIFANPINEIRDGLYKTYIKGATNFIRKQKKGKDFCVSVFSDNAGGIIFDDNYLVTHKVETHNTPSALDPYGGAITGIGGVNRDCLGFGLGAKPIANTYGFCFGEPDDTRALYRDKERKEQIFPPKRIMEGVVKGINTGGNCSGIPTVSGFVRFDDRYRGKPLVFAGTVGIIPRKIGNQLSHEKGAGVGDYIVMIGGKVGADGIHGATFSSVVMDSNSPATAVQIGDPITQKKFSDALVREARTLNLYSSITDNGAGGLSCSVAEMAKECGGARVELEKIPPNIPGSLPGKFGFQSHKSA